jgi:hypothetical protein
MATGLLEAVGVGDGDATLTNPAVAVAAGGVVFGFPEVTTAPRAVPPQHSTSKVAKIPRISGQRDFVAGGT